ncbi:MAG: hypothetical protein ACERKD_17045 [Prolixibacteraceae bacterium]
MQLTEVQNKKTENEFLKVPKILYRNDPVWVCPLDNGIRAIFNIEFSWVGDFNPKMRKIFISVGSVPAKHYITYRYLFDRKKEYKRYPIEK